MQIMIVSNGLPLKSSPLLGIFELDQARALKKQGASVKVLCIDLRSVRRKRKLGLEHGVIDGIEWYRYAIPLGNVPIEFYELVGRWALQHLYRKVYKKNTPDIIHAHFYDMGIIAGTLSKKLKVPLIITEHSSLVIKKQISKRFRRELKKGYASAHKVIAVSEGLQKQILEHTGVKSIIVNNVVDISQFEYAKKQHKGFGYIMTANLIPRKNPRLLLEAFIKVHKEDKDTFLGYIGDGIERKYLEEQAEVLGLKDSVHFYGRKGREDYSALYGNYDCFVLPSNAETFGVVIIEGFACGLPCIATRCGGPEYIVDESNGMIVPQKDKDALAQAMMLIKENKKRYDPNQIIEKARSKYSYEFIGKQLFNVYREVMK